MTTYLQKSVLVQPITNPLKYLLSLHRYTTGLPRPFRFTQLPEAAKLKTPTPENFLRLFLDDTG